MLNVNDLERRHKRYKQKLLIPYIIIFISLTIIIFSIFYFYTYNPFKTTSDVKKTQTISIQTIKKEEKNIDNNKTVIKEPIINKAIKQEQNNSVLIKEKRLILSPSFNFIQKMQENTSPYYEENNNIEKKQLIKKDVPAKKELPIKKKELIIKTIVKEEIIIEEPKVEIEKKHIIKIKRKDTYDDIQHVIKRFKNNNSPALSLFIAKKYYLLQEYDKAYNYALITNKINNNIEASWIIFAKSLVKLNKKDMAIRTLKTYIDQSYSSQARLLLDEIISGKFQ